MKITYLFRVIPALVVCLLAPNSLLHAQNDLSASVVDEILVTARKRSESFQEVPVTVNVYTETDLEESGVETPHDFIALTPNMTLVQTQNPGNSFITIRGVSQARNSDMPVAVLVDGVLLSNPAALNQELFDIQQIEVLKGPQGALYGRNAIGGAITITTKQPSDQFEAKIETGVDSGDGYKVQAALSGPVGNLDTLKYRASFSYKDTDGYLDNEYLNEKADPYKDTSARIKLLWDPSEVFSADFRASYSEIDTTALYFVINDDYAWVDPNASAVSGVSVPAGSVNDSNYTGVPILVDNPGEGLKEMVNVSLKLDYEMGDVTFTSITAWDDLEELLTGDAFDFRPLGRSFNENIMPIFLAPFVNFIPPNVYQGRTSDWNQSQWLTVESVSQEFRFTSPASERLRWIAGAYALATDRFISTGNMVDTGSGVNGVFRNPRTTTGFPYDFSIENPQATFLSDSQDNFAWAVFGELAYDVSDTVEASFALRWDKDTREQTTETPSGFIPDDLIGDLVTGQKRKETWDSLQPKLSLSWRMQDNLNLYGSLSRGFRSGGFNQSGVALAGVAGVFDTFDEQVADTIEVGFKGQFLDNRLSAGVSAYYTELTGAYYFIFLVNSSTQNLGSLDEVRYQGIEFETTAIINEYFDLNAGLALMDSEIIDDASIPHVEGEQVPLSSDYTFNLGGTLNIPMGNMDFFARADYQIIGDTYWGPGDPGTDPLPWDENPRDAVDLLDVRFGLRGNNWSLTAWSKNALDEEYNGEYTHPFVWKAPPRRYGLDLILSF